jgi:hypothetical protein
MSTTRMLTGTRCELKSRNWGVFFSTKVFFTKRLIHGVGYGGDQQFYSKDQFGHSLRMLIEYAEQNTAAAPDGLCGWFFMLFVTFCPQ